jgi:hypothetical protein
VSPLGAGGRCGRCGHPVLGWRCSGCGRPRAAAGFFLLVTAGLFLLTVAGLATPGTALPTVVCTGEAREYFFQSGREAVLGPLAAAAVGLFLLAAALLISGSGRGRVGARADARPEESGGAPEDPGGGRARLGGGARSAVIGTVLPICLGAVALCVAGMGLAEPALRFRRASVYPDRVELASLLLTHAIPRGEVAGARMLQDERGGCGSGRCDLRLEVRTVGGRRYLSVGRSLPLNDPALAGWRGAMRRFVAELEAPPRVGPGAAGSREYY